MYQLTENQKLRLIIKDEKTYFFYATDCLSKKLVKLRKNEITKDVLINTVIEVKANVMTSSVDTEIEAVELISEFLANTDKQKILIENGAFDLGDKDEYGDVIMSLGKIFVKNGKKMRYAYFTIAQ